MNNEQFGYFNDDGTKIDIESIVKPILCSSCKKDNNPSEEILCNLNRADQQNEEKFYCEAYETNK